MGDRSLESLMEDLLWLAAEDRMNLFAASLFPLLLQGRDKNAVEPGEVEVPPVRGADDSKG